MILGISLAAFTKMHVILSALGIASGLIVLSEMLRGKVAGGWTAIFLATTVLTSVTGFPIPPFGFDAPRGVGALSLVLLAFAIAALYVFNLARHWRWIYVVTAITALYLNCFIAVTQAFQKVPVLHAAAPKQAEPPFLLAQVVLFVIFVALGLFSLARFYPDTGRRSNRADAKRPTAPTVGVAAPAHRRVRSQRYD